MSECLTWHLTGNVSAMFLYHASTQSKIVIVILKLPLKENGKFTFTDVHKWNLIKSTLCLLQFALVYMPFSQTVEIHPMCAHLVYWLLHCIVNAWCGS